MSERPQGDDARAERLARAARAARELSEAVWDCLQEQVQGAEPARAQALAERLADVSATLALLLGAEAGALALRLSGPAAAPPADPPAATSPVGAERDARSERAWPAPAAPPRAPSAAGPPTVLDRRTPPEPVAAPPSSPGTRLVDEQEPTATVTPLSSRSAQPATSSVGGEAGIEIREPRRDEGASAWISSVGRMLERFGQDGLPFAVLLVEIVDVAHFERSETPHDLHGIVAQVELALGSGMRATDELSRETLGRYWLLAPETNGTGARMLAERLARLVRGSASHRGVPMEVAIGIAVCPEDGLEAPTLAARADLGVYSARATGRSISHTAPPVR